MARLLFVSICATLLLGCHSAPAPTPPVTLPTLTVATVTLNDTAAAQNIWVARDAVVVRNGIPGVFVLQDGHARFRMVRRGRDDKSRVQVLSGLRGNETLVLAAGADLHDGSPVVARAANTSAR